MNRVNSFKLVLWSIVGLAAAVGLTRFIFGLGAVTNLSDATPWGLWIGFDVMGGVALAAGGFVITAIVYIMKREEFRPIVKPAVLTAFLGYIAVAVGLLFDLGLPWNIWHMIIFWNPHSPLFEVGWCVMLYTSVLLLEFSPVPLEKTSRYARIRNVLMKVRFPLVLLGIMLSTLHQSSLGSLFLIMPFKLYPLWYSNILPILFFISAVALGLAMVSLEGLVSNYFYKREPESDLIAKLLYVAFWVLGLYLVVRLADIIIAGKFNLIFSGSWESILFITEIAIAAIIPMVLFIIPKVRRKITGQWIGSSMVILGFVFNRINVGGLTMLRATGDSYLPSWMEFTISAGVVSGAVLVFLYAIEHFKVWEAPPRDPEADPHKLPTFDRSSEVWLGAPRISARTKYSMAFIIAMSIGFAFISETKIEGKGVPDVVTSPARGGDTLFIDGNRDSYGVLFLHEMHVNKLGGKDSCAVCHHMNIPLDRQSGCYQCHTSMYQPASAFNHDWHRSKAGANIPCDNCHRPGLERMAATAKKCEECHLDLIPANSRIKFEKYVGPSYADAMHIMCISCHNKKMQLMTEKDKKDLTICTNCHEIESINYLKAELKEKLQGPYFNHVVLPGPRLTEEAKTDIESSQE
jgi:Ni/Fe-hydrogenase subunit HybB-like protein